MRMRRMSIRSQSCSRYVSTHKTRTVESLRGIQEKNVIDVVVFRYLI